MKAIDIQAFYAEQLGRVKANSAIHYHANIHKALKYAVKNDLLDSNPADKVERPKKERFIGGFYDNDELNRLFEAASGTQLELLSREAREAMDTADVIISKGMANTETLYGCGYNIYYAFLVKCQRFVGLFNKPLMSAMLIPERK